MIAFRLAAGKKVYALQSATVPLVYLDQWAYMSFAKDQRKLERFADEIVRSDATLAFSILNYYELSRISDLNQLSRIEDLLGQIWPRLVFVNSDPTAVIEREDDPQSGMSNQAPHLDDWMLSKFADRYRAGMNPRNPKGFLLQLRNPRIADGLRDAYCKLVRGVIAAVEKSRDMYQRDGTARIEVCSRPKGKPVPHPTRYIFEQAVYSIVKGNFNTRNANEVADFLHMVVPLSYCDVVLLDKSWAARAHQAQNAVKNGGLLTYEAAIFSPKTVEEFWVKFGRHCPSRT